MHLDITTKIFLASLWNSLDYYKAKPYLSKIKYENISYRIINSRFEIQTDVIWSDLYETSIYISEKSDISSNCTCPAHWVYNIHCKHVAALALRVVDQYNMYVGRNNKNASYSMSQYFNDMQNSSYESPHSKSQIFLNQIATNKKQLPIEELYFWVSFQFERSTPYFTVTAHKLLKKWWYSSWTKASSSSSEQMYPITKIFAELVNQRYRTSSFMYKPKEYMELLKISQPNLIWINDGISKQPIDAILERIPLTVNILPNSKWYSILPCLMYQWKDQALIVSQSNEVFFWPDIRISICNDSTHWLIYNTKKRILIFFVTEINHQLMELFYGQLQISGKQLEEVVQKNTSNLWNFTKLISSTIPWIQTITDAIPRYVLDVWYSLEEWLISLREYVKYYYSNRTFEVSSPESPYISTLDWALIQRDIKTENNLIAENSGWKQPFDLIKNEVWTMQLPLVSEQIHQLIDTIWELEKSWKFEVKYVTPIKKISKNTKITANIIKNMDRFDLDLTIENEDKSIDTLIIREALAWWKKYVEIPWWTAVSLWQELQKRYSQMRQLDIDKNSKLAPDKISRASLSWLENIAWVTYNFDKESIALYSKLKHFDTIEEQKVTTKLQATLRPYQLLGLNRLWFLHDYWFNWILADDMWLGKTLQTIARLLKCYVDNNTVNFPSKKDHKPTLIICPKSLVYNWYLEFEKFAPSLSAQMIHTRQESDLLKQPADIYIMSYDTAAWLQSTWHLEQLFYYVILDEAQYIKNPTTLRATAICSLKSLHKLALTGTPIENNLVELRSIFNFLMPGFLWKIKSFQDVYAKQNDMIGWLSQRVKPFILRRLKKDVLTDLPDKVEEIIYLEMEESQKKAYDNLKNTYQVSLLQDIEQQWVAKMQFAILDALLKMRQMCLHPALTKLSTIKKPQSAKLDYLSENIQDLISWWHTILMFSQFTGFLDYVREILDKENLEYSYLDGSCTSKARMQAVDDFNNWKNKIFLISLKAWWTGLNLVAADYVIHLDPRRNPAVEQQATDRAHRIWQTKTVFVQKLIIKDSIEEKILELQQEKKKLIDDVFSGNFGNTLTKDDVKHIFG